MNVLMISLDSTLARDKEKVTGDTQDRHILYGEYLSKLFIIVLARNERKLTTKKLSDNVIVYPICYSNPFSCLWNVCKACKKICKKNKIDVITTQDPLLTGLIGYALKRKFKIPLNMQLHGNYLNNKFWLKESRLNYFLNILGNFVVKRADSIRVVSDEIGTKLKLKLNIPDEKISVFPVFINIDKFINSPRVNFREKFSEFENIVLFVGRLSKEKNVEALLIAAEKVLKKCPKRLFLIVGDGKMRKYLGNLAQELKIEQNVIFEGTVNHELIPSYYQSCDLLVLPSKYEGMPLVIPEALACGKPVVVSDACRVSEFVINGERGFIFPVNRADILAEKITYLLNHPKLREELGERGKRYVIKIMDINKNAYKYRELYQKTIELAKTQNRTNL